MWASFPEGLLGQVDVGKSEPPSTGLIHSLRSTVVQTESPRVWASLTNCASLGKSLRLPRGPFLV